ASTLAGALFAEWRAMGQAADAPRTLHYWSSLAEALANDFFGPGSSYGATATERGVSQMRAVEQLPQAGVDGELLAVLPKLAKLRDACAAATKGAKWYHGVLWPTPAPMLAARKQAEEIEAELERLRGVLSKRYGREFCKIPCPSW
ncbi:MAG: hypothetical protein K2W96_28280, partial [Gemmataceae bacterium]|nr:hypothetical protein [Gemmataceae bacterium]